MLGRYDSAMEKYVKALHVYDEVQNSIGGSDEDVVSESSIGDRNIGAKINKEERKKKTFNQSYAITLVNIGLLYRAMVERSAFSLDVGTESKGESMTALQKIDALERAKEALSDAAAIRADLKGDKDRDTIVTYVHLASIYRMQNLHAKAQHLLEDKLALAIELFGSK
jgi:tetratricopeptide (TPR) repeat protein